MQIDGAHVGPYYDKLWNSDYSQHLEKMKKILSKTIEKPKKLKTVRSESNYESKNIEWNKKFNNRQLYLKLMEIEKSKPNLLPLQGEEEAKERMIRNMHMARLRKMENIGIENIEIVKRIEKASSERTLISELFSDRKEPPSLGTTKRKHKKQKKKCSI